jgi:hypothetical protein
MSFSGSIGLVVRRGILASPAFVVAPLLLLAAACGSGMENPIPKAAESAGLSSSSKHADAGTQYSFQFFDPPGSPYVNSLGINDLGVVVGSYSDAVGVAHGFIRSRNGTFTTIDPPGSVFTLLTSINDFGVIVGGFGGADGRFHGLKLGPDGAIAVIDFPGMSDTYLGGVNDLGGIVGGFDLGVATDDTGFRYRDGHFTLLGNPPGAAPAPTSQVSPFGLNNLGVIGGAFRGPDLNFHGFLLHETHYTTLDYPGGDNTNQTGLNDLGAAVGFFYSNTTGPSGGYLFDIGRSTFTEFECSGGLALPWGINNRGQIGGWCLTDVDGAFHGFIATPVKSHE